MHQVLSIPFSAQGSGIMWFMYTLIGLYIVSPVISPWLETVKKSTLELYIAFWLLTMCFPLFEMALEVNSGITGLYYYLSGYIGYFILGYYLRMYGEQIQMRLSLLLFLLSLSVPVIFWLLDLEVDFHRVFWYLSIFVVVMAIFWFRLCQKYMEFRSRKLSFVARLSNLSFGIYLIHIFVMRNWIWTWKWIMGIENYALQVFVIFICVMIISLAVSYLIALIPGGNYIVGYRINKK